MDHGDARPRRVGGDQVCERLGIFLRIDSAGTCVYLVDPATTDFSEQFGQVRRSLLPADILDVGTA
ncbi:hypothetical protein PJL18_04374 [Paenarthrobacter nicotinovorans]|nr:hypothetical protein [Paenarthrobacter nicotinovorans]